MADADLPLAEILGWYRGSTAGGCAPPRAPPRENELSAAPLRENELSAAPNETSRLPAAPCAPASVPAVPIARSESQTARQQNSKTAKQQNGQNSKTAKRQWTAMWTGRKRCASLCSEVRPMGYRERADRDGRERKRTQDRTGWARLS
jgi:hypothetical protein